MSGIPTRSQDTALSMFQATMRSDVQRVLGVIAADRFTMAFTRDTYDYEAIHQLACDALDIERVNAALHAMVESTLMALFWKDVLVAAEPVLDGIWTGTAHGPARPLFWRIRFSDGDPTLIRRTFALLCEEPIEIEPAWRDASRGS